MSAELVNLTDGTPMDVEGWKFVGTKAESMSSYVRSMREHPQAVGVDHAAETRLWGSGALTQRAVQHPIDPKDRWVLYAREVGYAGKWKGEQ